MAISLYTYKAQTIRPYNGPTPEGTATRISDNAAAARMIRLVGDGLREYDPDSTPRGERDQGAAEDATPA
jgi:hypothetical protein